MSAAKYARLRQRNLLTRPAVRDNTRWSAADDERLLRHWATLNSTGRVYLAVDLGRTLIACQRRMTILKRRKIDVDMHVHS